MLKFLFIYLLKITNKNQLFAQTNKLIQKPKKIISWDKNNQILRQNRENGNVLSHIPRYACLPTILLRFSKKKKKNYFIVSY